MKISVLKPHELSPDLLARWKEIQTGNKQFQSPYFRPEFTQAVAQVRRGVEIGLLEEGGEAIGFFPYERTGWSGARPVGGKLCDFQAVIARPEASWTVEQLLRGCRLSSWQFHHLLASQPQFARYHVAARESVYLDLSEGFDAYRLARRKAGSDKINQVFQSHRKVEREVGPVRFVPAVTDESVFAWLLEHKSEQYRRTGVTDLFRYPWTVRLLRNIWAQPTDEFRGVLSALYFGDTIAAVHFGMRCRGVLHSWFPAYDRTYSRYSPGLMMTTLMAREFAALGVTRIDLGKGDEPYKQHFRSAGDLVAEGAATGNPLAWSMHQRISSARLWAKRHPLTQQLQTPLRWYRQFRDWFSLA